jgi:hypothetical protein
MDKSLFASFYSEKEGLPSNLPTRPGSTVSDDSVGSQYGDVKAVIIILRG